MIFKPSSTSVLLTFKGGATKIQFQRTKVNMPNSLILAAILFEASESAGFALNGVSASFVVRFFTNSIQPNKPVFLSKNQRTSRLQKTIKRTTNKNFESQFKIYKAIYFNLLKTVLRLRPVSFKIFPKSLT